MQVEGIGPNIAEAVVDWFATPANLQVLRKLRPPACGRVVRRAACGSRAP